MSRYDFLASNVQMFKCTISVVLMTYDCLVSTFVSKHVNFCVVSSVTTVRILLFLRFGTQTVVTRDRNWRYYYLLSSFESQVIVTLSLREYCWRYIRKYNTNERTLHFMSTCEKWHRYLEPFSNETVFFASWKVANLRYDCMVTYRRYQQYGGTPNAKNDNVA